MTTHKLLIVDDEPNMREMLADILTGYEVDVAGSAAEAQARLDEKIYDLLILDLKLPDKSGMDVLADLAKKPVRPAVIVITAHGSVDKAVTAMRQGAYDFITKPFDIGRIRLAVAQALESRQMAERASAAAPRFGDLPEEIKLVGSSAPFRSVLDTIDKIAATEAAVLIRGETGTGKELVARTIHLRSPRRHGPFISINCAAIPETLLESELFGFEKGAFTGAASRKIGQMALAAGGTLFLDEIGDLSLSSQAKLLRAIEDHEFMPLGSETKSRVDVRIIAATHRDLEDMMSRQMFREDLFFRLNVVPISLPPLRQRKEDIPSLAQHFLDKCRYLHQRGPIALPPEIMEELMEYEWPGNARELENAIEKFVIMGNGDISLKHGPLSRLHRSKDGVEFRWGHRTDPETANGDKVVYRAYLGNECPPDTPWSQSIESDEPMPGEKLPVSLKTQARNAERDLIVRTLQETGGNKKEAAKRLGVSYKTLFNKLDRLGVVVKPKVE